jgi:hypothetical protein
VPTFCRHNRFLANCPICSRDQVEAVRPARGTGSGTRTAAKRAPSSSTGRTGGVRISRVAREQEDGFRSSLVPGIKASAAAERLAEELAFAAARLDALASDPPGLYREVAELEDREEALWLAFQIAYLCPLDAEDPFAGVRAARVPWAGGALPALDGVPLGPRTAHDPARGGATPAAYRAWAERAGSQQAAFAGEAAWPADRRFARTFERLALPGLHRDARFDLLVTIGRLGLHDVEAGSLHLGGSDDTTVSAKRIFGIADTLLLERRAADLASACGVPLAALDLALWNWNRPPRPGAAPERAHLGAVAVEPDPDAYARVAEALGL